MARRHIWMDDEVWESINKAAAREQLDTGQSVSAAAWIREAVEERLERLEKKAARKARKAAT